MHRNSGLVLLVSGLATLLLGWWGFLVQFTIVQNNGTLFDAFYRSIQLFWLRSGSEFYNPVPQIEIARFAAVVIFTFSTIYVFSNVFNEQYRLFSLQSRTFLSTVLRRYYRSFTPKPGHVVICGAGFLGSALACHFHHEGREVIVLEKDEKKSEVKTCRENGALVLHRDAMNPGILESVRVQHAAEVFILTGDNSRNTDIASTCAKIAMDRPEGLSPLSCHVHIEDANLSFALRQWENELSEKDIINFSFFNLYHATGRSAADCLFSKMLTEKVTDPVLLIIGLGDFGKSLLINVVKRWRDTRFSVEGKITIVVIDKDADNRIDSFKAFFPGLDDFSTITPGKMDVHSGKFVRGEFLVNITPQQLIGVFVCLRDEGDAASVGITLHEALCSRYGCPRAGPSTPWIIVRTVDEHGMTQVVRKMRKSLGWKIYPFPVLTDFCKNRYENEILERLAKATHNDYCKREKKNEITEETNPSLALWNSLPEDLKDTNRAQARSLIENIRDYGYMIVMMRGLNETYLKFGEADPMITELAMKEHDRFVKMKRAQGYRWGPKNDKLNKINSTLIEWDKLPQEEKDKDIKTVLEMPKRLADVSLKLEYYPPFDKRKMEKSQGIG